MTTISIWYIATVISFLVLTTLLGVLHVRWARKFWRKQDQLATNIDTVAEEVHQRFQRRYGRPSATMTERFPRLKAR